MLSNENNLIKLENLNYTPQALDFINKIINEKTGIFIVTGAVNTGKTTLFKELLKNLKDDNNIVNIEENLIQDNLGNVIKLEKNEIDFNQITQFAIRNFNPDIISIEDIKDKNNLLNIIKNSLTGYKFLITTDGENVNSLLKKIEELEYIPNDILSGILAQSLVQELCECKLKDYENKGYRKNECGCLKCNYTGYKGLIPLTDIMHISKIDKLEKYTFEDCAKELFENGKIDFITKKRFFK